MGEEDYVRHVAELCGVSYRKEPRGEYWDVSLRGRRVIEVLKEIRAFLYGFKAQAADIALKIGPSLPGEHPRPILPSLKGKKMVDREGFEPSA